VRTLRLSKRAKADLYNIWNYTVAEFGENQAERYLSSIEEGFNLLLEHGEIGKPADHIGVSLRALSKDSHIIYYMSSESYVDVMGVLHERMDPTDRL